MTSERSIRDRLFQARDEAAQVNLDASMISVSENMSIYPVLADMDDLDMLDGELGEPNDGDGLVKMANADELYLALHIAAAELGVFNDGPAKIAKVGHENQHAQAARFMGLIGIHAVRFVMRQDGMAMKVTTLPVGDNISKLGYASILAHPRILSRSDLHKLALIGYDDAVDVARHIRRAGANMPIPLSI